MQNGNDTTDTVQRFPWSEFYAGENDTRFTTTDGPHRPRLVLHTTDTDEEDADPNDFVDVPHRSPDQTSSQTIPITPTETQETHHGTSETLAVPGRITEDRNSRPIPPRNAEDISVTLHRETVLAGHASTQSHNESIRGNDQSHGTDGTNRDMAGSIIRTTPDLYLSYHGITTYTKVRDRVTLICNAARLQVDIFDQERIARVWRLLMDFRTATTLAGQARDQYNYHCADLIETFVNVTSLYWEDVHPKGGNLDQLAIDLLRRLLTADIERYIILAIESIDDQRFGLKIQPHDQNNRIAVNHWLRATEATPDRHQATRCIMEQYFTLPPQSD